VTRTAEEDVLNMMYSTEVSTEALEPGWEVDDDPKKNVSRAETPLITRRMLNRMLAPEEEIVDPAGPSGLKDVPNRIVAVLLGPWRGLPEWARMVIIAALIFFVFLVVLAGSLREPLVEAAGSWMPN
jgi:hypothetical protein